MNTETNNNIAVNIANVPSATEIAEAPVTKPAKATKTKTKTKGPGRPAATVKFPRGRFTIKELQTLNPNVKPVTVRVHVTRAVEKGMLTRLSETVKTGKKGKPAFRFVLTSSVKSNRKNSKNKNSESIAAVTEATAMA